MLLKQKNDHLLLWSVALLAGTVLMLAYIWTRVEATRRGYVLSELTREHVTIAREHARLELQAAGLRAPGRIEQLARTKLGMAPPSADRIVEVMGDQWVAADHLAAQR